MSFDVDSFKWVEIAIDVAKHTIDNGGATYSVSRGEFVRDGYAVSIAKEIERIVPESGLWALASEIVGYLLHNVAQFDDPAACLGTWVHEGNVYLDVSLVYSDKETALTVGRENLQIAIFDLSTFTEISCAVEWQDSFPVQV